MHSMVGFSRVTAGSGGRSSENGGLGSGTRTALRGGTLGSSGNRTAPGQLGSGNRTNSGQMGGGGQSPRGQIRPGGRQGWGSGGG